MSVIYSTWWLYITHLLYHGKKCRKSLLSLPVDLVLSWNLLVVNCWSRSHFTSASIQTATMILATTFLPVQRQWLSFNLLGTFLSLSKIMSHLFWIVQTNKSNRMAANMHTHLLCWKVSTKAIYNAYSYCNANGLGFKVHVSKTFITRERSIILQIHEPIKPG